MPSAAAGSRCSKARPSTSQPPTLTTWLRPCNIRSRAGKSSPYSHGGFLTLSPLADAAPQTSYLQGTPVQRELPAPATFSPTRVHNQRSFHLSGSPDATQPDSRSTVTSVSQPCLRRSAITRPEEKSARRVGLERTEARGARPESPHLRPSSGRRATGHGHGRRPLDRPPTSSRKNRRQGRGCPPRTPPHFAHEHDGNPRGLSRWSNGEAGRRRQALDAFRSGAPRGVPGAGGAPR